jgi:RND family efflux transporter MFP subunit
MRKAVIVVVVAVLAVAGVVVYNRTQSAGSAAALDPNAGQAGSGGRFGRGGPRAPMPVEFAVVKRAPMAERVMVVGNLIGAATVQVVPKVNGRLQTVNVKLGDPVRRGQIVAKVEDNEIREQVNQAEASYKVGQATIRQRDADLKLAQTNLDRNRSLLERELLPRQTYDDTEARHQAAIAQLDLARAQFEQAKARLDELKINLANTVISSPVDGFVAKRFLDPGAFVGPNAAVASLVDIRTVRLVANLVEKDAKRVRAGTPGEVEVDAYPGETFKGVVSRVAPVFDPSTRTAEMEIEVANASFRLKPGMYARVQLTVDRKADALTVPRNALVDFEGKTGVFVASAPAAGGDGRSGGSREGAGPSTGSGQSRATGSGGPLTGSGQAASTGSGQGGPPTLIARFMPVETGIREGEQIEIRSGLNEGTRVITVGAGALRDGDQVVAATGAAGRPSRGSGQAPSTGSGQGGRGGRGARGSQ